MVTDLSNGDNRGAFVAGAGALGGILGATFGASLGLVPIPGANVYLGIVGTLAGGYYGSKYAQYGAGLLFDTYLAAPPDVTYTSGPTHRYH